MAKKHFIAAEDLYRFQILSGCTISPDGNRVIFCVQHVDRKTEKKWVNIWIVPANGGPERQFTYGNQSDRQPQWSPDGSEIAFTSNRKDEKQGQIYVIPSDGGEARQLTDLKGTFGTFEWSPDGKHIVFMFRKADSDAVERESDDQKKTLGIVSRHITRAIYKLDGAGFLPKERWHIWVVDTKNGKSKQLTDSDAYDELSPRWSPDGKTIVFCSNRAKDPDAFPQNIDLFVISATGGDFRKVATPPGSKELPAFSPDGKWLAYYGQDEIEMLPWKQSSLWVAPVSDNGRANNLTEKFDFHTSSFINGDLSQMPPPLTPPAWSKDGKALYFQVAHHGSVTLKSISMDGNSSSLRTVIGDEGVVENFGFDRQQTRVAYLHANVESPSEVWLRNLSTGGTRKLSHVNDRLLKSLILAQTEEVWFKGSSNNDLQGWILRPPDFDQSRKYPAIIEIHGGPQVQYGSVIMHEFQYLAAQGYVVCLCNPRGGTGYGQAHLKAIRRRWGTVDYEDLMAWADFLEKKPYIDKERMGVTGGSYGGYMTNWIIGHTNRFKAAVSERGISNGISMYATSDNNAIWQLHVASGPPWEKFEEYWQQSPLKYVGNVKTPTLMIQSEADLRCSIEQGEQLFVALKKLGVDTEMMLFPESSHALSREGRTDRRIERLNYIREWFDRYLKLKGRREAVK